MKIGIDPGHGGSDPGAIGAGGLKEKDVTLSVGLLVLEMLKGQGSEVTITRMTDKDVTPTQRTNMLNAANVNLVVSIHVNSVADPRPNYVSSFIIARGGNAEKAAKVLQQELQIATSWPKPNTPDGVVIKNLHMTRETLAPAVLVEMGFISNPQQEKQLKDVEFHKVLASAIVKGVCKHFNKTYIEPTSQAPVREDVTVIAGDKQYSGNLIGGKTYVHVRVLEEFGLLVQWDESTRTVYVGAMPEIKLPRHEKLATCDVITAKAEQLKIASVKGKLIADGINGGYFDATLSPLGAVTIDGKAIASGLSYKPPRAVFTLTGDKADIVKADNAKADYALGAGPILLPAVAIDEGFQDDIMTSNRPRSAVGITSDGLVKLVATDNMTLRQLSKLMTDLGCIKAMNLDGGGSTHMRFGGSTVRGGGRAISTAIVIREGI